MPAAVAAQLRDTVEAERPRDLAIALADSFAVGLGRLLAARPLRSLVDVAAGAAAVRLAERGPALGRVKETPHKPVTDPALDFASPVNRASYRT